MLTNNEIEPVEEKLSTFMEHQEIYTFEGERGIKNFTKIVEALGYRSREAFWLDNSGALEAVVEWIGNQRIPEWNEKLADNIVEDIIDDTEE